MPLLTEQEIYEMADDGVFLGNVKEITRAVEAAVIEKIKAQRPISVETLTSSGKKSYRHYYYLPEGD